MAKAALFENYQHMLVPALLLWLAGALFAASSACTPTFYGLWIGIGFISLVLSLLFRAPRMVIRLWVGFLCFLLGSGYFALFHFQPQSDDISLYASGNPAQIKGVLVDYGRTNEQWVLKSQELIQKDGHQSVSGQVMVHLRKTAKTSVPLEVGQTVQLSGFLREPSKAAFPGDFDYKDYLYQNKMTAVLFSQEVTVLEHKPTTLWLSVMRYTDSLRSRITETFQKAVPGIEGQILASVVLGDHAVGMERDTKQQFIRSGLVHVLAASGLNVGLIGAFLLFIGRLCKLPLRFNLVIAMIGVAFYCLLTGLPPSVLRAGTMFEITLALKFIRKEMHAVTLLGIAGFILTLFNPMIVSMIGFQLSFLSSLGILVMVQPLQEKLGFYVTAWLADLLLIPIIAQLWVTPILIYTFHQVPLMSLPANLIALPLVTLLTYAGFVLGGFSLIAPQLATSLIKLLWLPGMLLNQTAQFFSSLTYGTLSIPSVPLTSVLALMAIILILTYALNFPHRLGLKPALKIITVCFVVAVIPVSIAKWQSNHQASISWISENPSHNIQVILLPQKTAIVSVQSLKPWTATLTSRYLKQQGVNRIQLLIFQSPLATNVEGLNTLSESMTIGEVVFPKGLAEHTTNALIAWSLKTHVPIAAINDTYLVEGPGIKTTLYNIQNQETMMRTEIGNQCFVDYWGIHTTAESPLLPMAKDCVALNEQGWLKLRVNQKPQRVKLNTFHQLVFASNTLRLQ